MGAPTSTGDQALDNLSLHTHWLLRLAWAGVFLYMGIDKFMGGGVGEFAEIMGLPYFIGLLVALAEIGAGTLILVGAFTSGWVTRLAALMGIPVLLGAIFMEHWGQWHFMATPSHPLGGMMFQVTLLLLGTYVLARGNEM
jgi:putative oxidoreductase